MRLWPFWLPTAALLSCETAQMENQGDLNASSEAPTLCFNTIFSTYPEHFHRRVFVNKIIGVR